MNTNEQFSEQQKQYLSGFVAGTGIARTLQGLPTFAAMSPAGGGSVISAPQLVGPDAIHHHAQDQVIAAGKKLSPEEAAKCNKNPLDMYDDVCSHAAAQKFPKGTDVFAFKYHGLFYVAPAQDAYMCRLRIPAGILNSHQMRGLADIADRYAGGYSDVTTRANLQLREIPAAAAAELLMALQDIGVVSRGSGADNIRNVTANPTAGIDPQELIDVRPLARQMHHYILNHREMYGLPRKFNIAFDGGGTISALEETNDIGFAAIRIGAGESEPEGVYFRLQLGGITGHGDFARDTGVLLRPEECVPVAAALVKVFIQHGDRTDRKKARLKYVLDRLGFEKYLELTEEQLGSKLRRFPLEQCQPRGPIERHGHLGFHPQRQPGLQYVGVVLPVGRISSEQMRGLAAIADRHGSGTIRLTVWQNLLISDVPDKRVPDVKQEIEDLGLGWSASNVRGALVACTGSKGCKFASGDTKGHGLAICDYLDSRIQLDTPINIHLTGCHHSCAQHYIGDIGLLATKVEQGDDLVEGYHVYLGGGYGSEQGIGREMYRSVPIDELPPLVERMLVTYQSCRTSSEETFREFVLRQPTEQLRDLVDAQPALVAS